MCARFAIDSDADHLNEEFGITDREPGEWQQEWHGSYSIAPTDSAPIIRDRGRGRFLELVRWDWQKPTNRPGGQPIIHARLEKLNTSFWLPALTASRVVVPMRGYFEWTGSKNAKIPHFVHGNGLLAAAGLTWSMNVKGETNRCFVVITREARDAAGEVHNRMPAFLSADAVNAWLIPTKLDRNDRDEMLAIVDSSSTAIAATISQYVVDRKVNSVRAVDPDDPSIISPVIVSPVVHTELTTPLPDPGSVNKFGQF